MTDHAEALNKARYGHKDYVEVGENQFERLSVSSIKRAMLHGGSTKAKFCVIAANTGWHMTYSWRIGVNMIRNAKHLGIPA